VSLLRGGRRCLGPDLDNSLRLRHKACQTCHVFWSSVETGGRLAAGPEAECPSGPCSFETWPWSWVMLSAALG
jgi:hypothetical protein